MFRSLLDIHDHPGIRKIMVQANIDAGGYAWARHGFVPDSASWNGMRHSLLRKAAPISDAQVRAEAERILPSPDPASIMDLAAIRVPALNCSWEAIGLERSTSRTKTRYTEVGKYVAAK